jgi:hypothetical protein
MSQSGVVHWGRWATIGGLFLVTKGVAVALPGLTRVARDEVFLRGGDAVLLFEPSVLGSKGQIDRVSMPQPAARPTRRALRPRTRAFSSAARSLPQARRPSTTRWRNEASSRR